VSANQIILIDTRFPLRMKEGDMPALKYAEALGSGLGILFGIRSWGRIQGLEEKFPCELQQLRPRIGDFRKAEPKTLSRSKRRTNNGKTTRQNRKPVRPALGSSCDTFRSSEG
jgi:hypothetical protein